MKFKAKLRRIGNSLGVLIPRDVITDRQLGEVITLEVITKQGDVITERQESIYKKPEKGKDVYTGENNMEWCQKHKGSRKGTCGCS